MQDEKIITQKLGIAPFNLILIHPNFNFPTQLARAALPNKILLSDAVFNASHLVFVVEALRSGDLGLLNSAMQDRIHQPYRLPLIPGSDAVITAAQKAGAVTVLSGAGPSLLVFSPDRSLNKKISLEMQSAFQQAGLSSEVFFPEVSLKGAAVTSV
jgi:homoserine kinase